MDEDLKQRDVVDVFKSLIWTKRYFTYGEFELYLPASEQITDTLDNCPYVCRDDDDTIMIVENYEIQTDAENGDYYIVTGRSAESVLTRRIAWEQTNLNEEDAAEGVYILLENNVTDPTDAARLIPHFLVDETFTSTEPLKMQVTGAELAETITNICKMFGWGWKVTRAAGLGTRDDMVFTLYERGAVDVTFSREFDNLISSDYYQNSEAFKNVALVAGEGEGTERRRAVYNADPSAEGLERRELYVDARDISSNNGDIPTADYTAALQARGAQRLIDEHTNTYGFTGKVEPNTTYKYKIDYDIGNIVTVSNGYGVTAHPRIVEIIECWDDTGYTVCPTFETWEV
jgi:hypothetical protein